MAYRVLDYTGKLLSEGRLGHGWTTVGNTSAAGSRLLEIELPASGQRFGVVCLPAWRDEPDRFFAIDGALSWLVTDASSRETLIGRLIGAELPWSASG